MILEIAQLQVVAGRTTEFEAAFRTAQAIISAAPGHVSHELNRCVEDPDAYVLLVRWKSLHDHEEGFRKSAPYLEWKRLLHHFYGAPPTVLHYEAVHATAR
jgi:heme-degrading monooxygenase HmoA